MKILEYLKGRKNFRGEIYLDPNEASLVLECLRSIEAHIADIRKENLEILAELTEAEKILVGEK